MRSDNKEIGLKRMKIVDIQTSSNIEENTSNLIANAIMYARKQEVHILELTGFGKNIREQALKMNPYIRTLSYSPFFYKIISEKLKNVFSDEIKWDAGELGCWKGHSAYIISKLIKKSRKKINFHIFDSFEGLSDSCKKDGTFNLYNNKFKSAVTKQFQSSEDFVKDIVLKDFNFVKTYKGWIPKRFNEIKEKKFSLIHIDLCMYKPSIQSLNFFYPKLVKGGIIISNVYNSEVFQGEKKAWDEYFQNKKNKFYFKHALNGCFLLK